MRPGRGARAPGVARAPRAWRARPGRSARARGHLRGVGGWFSGIVSLVD